MNSESSVPDLVRMFHDVLPMKSDQKFVFQHLIDSIDYCERLGSSAWSITLTSWGFRLNVGQVEVMTCAFCCTDAVEAGAREDIWSVHLRVFLAGSDALSKISLDDALEAIDEGSYSSVGERHWCYTRFFQAATSERSQCDPSRDGFDAQLGALRSNRDKYLKLACYTSTGKLRQKSNFARSHCPALYELARLVTTVEPEIVSNRPFAGPQQTPALGAGLGFDNGGRIESEFLSAERTAKLPKQSTVAAGEDDVRSGFVYLLVNRSMPGLVKIGRTSRPIETRVRELNTPTGVPTPFEVILDIFVKDSARVERLVHEHLTTHRTANNREFFQVPTSTAIQAIYDAVLKVNGEREQ